jgi:hypothetical protein
MHLHEERFTLQITQVAILNGRTFGYTRKAVYLPFTFNEVFGSLSLVDSFSGIGLYRGYKTHTFGLLL